MGEGGWLQCCVNALSLVFGTSLQESASSRAESGGGFYSLPLAGLTGAGGATGRSRS